jgi:hypothetical protein
VPKRRIETHIRRVLAAEFQSGGNTLRRVRGGQNMLLKHLCRS